jgi:hypothetical protein
MRGTACLRSGAFGVLLVSQQVLAQGLVVTLSISDPEQRHGVAPQFTVTVAATTESVRVMNFQDRADLKVTYARLLVTAGGKDVDVPIVIADPGPVDDTDYIELNVGEELRFEHDGSPRALSALPPGNYSAVVMVQPDWRAEAVKSNEVKFVVR